MKEKERFTFKDSNKYLKKEDMIDVSYIKKLDLKERVYMIGLKNDHVIVKRIGRCNYKKCKNVCCKFFACTGGHEYWNGFGEINEVGDIIVKIGCKFLQKNGTCQKWGKRNFPRACKQFPHLDDAVFKHIMDECSFKYEIICTLPKVGDKIFQEMMLNFKEQIN